MKENVGDTDQVLRLLLGPALMLYGLRRRQRMSGVLSLIAGTLTLESGITRVCPLNAALGIDTRRQPRIDRMPAAPPAAAEPAAAGVEAGARGGPGAAAAPVPPAPD